MSRAISSSFINNKSYTVTVEGNIGSGKSTFLNRCQRYDPVYTIAELVEKWTNVGGENVLAQFYQDPAKHGFTLQSMITLSMLNNHLLQNGMPVKVMERSLYSARNCFVEEMRADGSLSASQYTILQEWYNFIDEHHAIQPDLISILTSINYILREGLPIHRIDSCGFVSVLF